MQWVYLCFFLHLIGKKEAWANLPSSIPFRSTLPKYYQVLKKKLLGLCLCIVLNTCTSCTAFSRFSILFDKIGSVVLIFLFESTDSLYFHLFRIEPAVLQFCAEPVLGIHIISFAIRIRLSTLIH